MKKILMISHTADIDGLGSVVLGKIIFDQNKDYSYEYKLVEFSELDGVINDLVQTNKYKDYDTIYITDVSIRNDSIDKIESNEELKSKIKHFDHHASEISNNKYSFINVVLEEKGIETCGTSLFYSYLCSNFDSNILHKESIKEFVEAVRCRDNWIKEKSEYNLGCDLTELQLMKGNDNYIDDISNCLINDMPLISKQDRIIIDRRMQNIQEYIEKCDNKLIFTKLFGLNVGISFSEEFRSEVGNALSKKYEDKIDFVLIINLLRGQYSLRTVKDDVDVSVIASKISRDGGGHPKASGATITKENTNIILDAISEQYDLEKDLSLKLK